MLGRTFGLIATTAVVGANALLLPPHIDTEKDPLFFTGLNLKERILRVPCSSCVFSSKAQTPQGSIHHASSDDSWFTIQGGAVDIIYNVTVSEDQQLYVNGDLWKHPMHMPKHIIQVPASASMEDIADGKVKTEVLEITESRSTYGDFFTQGPTYMLEAFALDGHKVDLDELNVRTATSSTGELDIIEVFTEPKLNSFDQFKSSVPSSDSRLNNCGHLPKIFCEMKDRLSKMVPTRLGGKKHGCGGKKTGPGRLMMGPAPITIGKVPGHIKPPFAFRPHGPHHPHRHGRPSSFHYHARIALWMFVCAMAAFVVGMIGAWAIVLVFLVARKVFYGVPFSGRRSVALDEAAAEEEGRGLLGEDHKMDDDEQLPVYEDAPAYEEKASVKIDEELEKH